MLLRLATLQDVDEIFEIVNSAYSVNIGNSGRAFKCANRYTSTKSVLEDLPFTWVLRAHKTPVNVNIIGCVKAVVNKNTEIVKIGPVAVRPDYQGKGYGTQIMNFIESLAPIQQVGVVSCRTDLMPIYQGRGYVIMKKDPIIEHVPYLTRTDLEYIIMVKNKSGLPIRRT